MDPEKPCHPRGGAILRVAAPIWEPYEMCCSSPNTTGLQEEMSQESIQVGCLIDPLTLRIPTTPPDSTLPRGAPLALILSG